MRRCATSPLLPLPLPLALLPLALRAAAAAADTLLRAATAQVEAPQP